MVRCPECETSNSTDSKFCKFCGAALPEEELIDAQLKLNELLSEGYRIFNEGRTEEARLIAESALESAPNTAQALTLKAMCCEREGELAAALELYEKVVELNPDSSLDKIKVTHLRNQLNAKQIEAPVPNRKLALVIAATAVVLVVCIGAIIAALTSDKASAADTSQLTASQEQPDSAFQRTGEVPQPKQGPQPDGEGNGQGQVDQKPDGGVITPPTKVQGNQIPGYEGSDNPFGPITFTPDSTSRIANTTNPRQPNQTQTNTNVTNPPVQPGGNDGGDPAPVPEKQTEEKKGIVEVTINHGTTNHGGSDDTGSPNELTALMKAANEQYLIGRYQNAAGAYERALRIGADTATTNQKLGQCYSNLGRKTEAINAYVRAADAYKNGLARTNSPSYRAGLDACNKALRVLRGE